MTQKPSNRHKKRCVMTHCVFRERGRCPYYSKIMLKVIIYAYMNNIYSCRKIEKIVQRDIHYIWLAA